MGARGELSGKENAEHFANKEERSPISVSSEVLQVRSGKHPLSIKELQLDVISLQWIDSFQ